MGAIEDIRKVLQDVVSPDLKALDARMTALERQVDHGTKALHEKIDELGNRLDQRIDSLGTRLDQKVDSAEVKLEQRIDGAEARLDQKIDLKFELMMNEIRSLSNTITSNHASVMFLLDLNRRMERVELERADRPAPKA